MPGEASEVGSIVGYLKLDRSDWDAQLTAAGIKARELSRSDPKVTISTNAREVIAELLPVKAAIGGLQGAQERLAAAQDKLNSLVGKSNVTDRQYATAKTAVAKATRDEELAQLRLAAAYAKVEAASEKRNQSAQRSVSTLGLLIPLLVGVGSALLPIAAVGVGAFAGLAATGAVAVLTVKGIQAEMKAGTAVGDAYSQGLSTVTGEISRLEKIAATDSLSGFQKAVASLVPLFPLLEKDTGLFSSQLSGIVSHLAPGLVALFTQLNPLFVQFGTELGRGSASFEHWATSSTTVSKFVAYVQTQLPGAEQTLGQLITLISHLVVGLGPLGGASLTSIGVLARLLNDIPISVLQVLIPLLLTGKIALEGFAAASGAAKSLSTWSKAASEGTGIASNFAGAAAVGSTALSALGVAGLVAAPIIGGLVGWLGRQSKAQQEATAQINSYTQALIASNGVVDESIYNSVAKALLDKGALANADKLGVAQRELTGAVTGNAQAWQNVKDQLQPLADQYTKLAMEQSQSRGHLSDQDAAQLKAAKSAKDLLSTLSAQRDEFNKGAAAQQLYASATTNVSASQSAANAAAVAGAALFNTTTDAYNTAAAAADKTATSTAATTLQMQLENNAAGLLNQALNSLAGQNLSVAQAQTALDSAVLTGMQTLKDNKSTLDEHTQAGIADRQAIEGMASAARAKLVADTQGKPATEAQTAAYQANAAQILANIAAQNGLISNNPKLTKSQNDAQTALNESKNAAYGYAQQLLTIPPVAKTKVELDAEQAIANLAALNAAIRATIPGSGFNITVGGKVKGYAAGGTPEDGVSTVGENGPEWMIKSGSQVRIVPMGRNVPLPAQTAVRGSGSSYSASTSPYASASPQQTDRVVVPVTLLLDGKVVAKTVVETNKQRDRAS